MYIEGYGKNKKVNYKVFNEKNDKDNKYLGDLLINNENVYVFSCKVVYITQQEMIFITKMLIAFNGE